MEGNSNGSSTACESPYAVLDLERLVRCFDVTSLLREQRFTRDVGACVACAGELPAKDRVLLSEIRLALEQRRSW